MVNPYNLRDDITNDGRTIKPEKILDIYALACLGIAMKMYSPASGCPVRGALYKQQDAAASNHAESKSGCDNTSNNIGANPVVTAVFDAYNNNSLVEISGGYVSGQDIANVERVILSTLSYRLSPPTSYTFIENVMQLISFQDNSHVRNSLTEVAKFQALLGSLDSDILTYPPSLTAAAALSNAVHSHLLLFLPNKARNPGQLFPMRQKAVGTMRVLMYRMEKALQISVTSDPTINSLRNKLNYLSTGSHQDMMLPANPGPPQKSQDEYQYSRDLLSVDLTDYSEEHDTTITSISRLPTIRRKRMERLPKKKRKSDITRSDETTWDSSDCFSIALDSILPQTSKSRKEGDTTKLTENDRMEGKNSSELIDHYNKFIRPQLYQGPQGELVRPSAGNRLFYGSSAPISTEIEESLRAARGERCSL